MRTKTKNISLLIAIILAFATLGVALCLYNSDSKNTAYAATTPKYTVMLSGTYTTGNWGGDRTNNIENVSSLTAVINISNGQETVALSLSGSSVSGTGTLNDKDYINFSDVYFTASQSKYTITIYNEYSNSVASGKGSVSASLPDGLYRVEMTYSTSSGAGYTQFRMSFNLHCYFTVDSHSPTIVGASTSTTGKYTNAAFAVSASDSYSGVENLYMKAPNSSSYTAVGTSKTVAAGSTNGLYSFYAKDKAGNSSATYYVFYDTSLPTVTVKNASGTAITSGYSNSAFSSTANDTGSGVSYMQYTTPSSSSWTTYTSGTSIAATAANGLYQFRAVDKAGNISVVQSIIKDTTKPTGQIYGGSAAVTSGGTTKASYIKFAASDTDSGVDKIYVKKPNASSYVAYTEGTQFTDNGSYSFYCTDKAGNTSATYTATLDNTAPVLSCSQTDFYSSTGYDFTVKATDAISSVVLYYKTPLMSSYQAASGGSYSVKTTDSDGKYYFYAQDALGNKSDEKWIELKVAVPTATIERDNNTNYYRITWDGSSTGRLNDNPYTKGTWIKTEGEYTFVITNSSNRSNTYHFTISHGFVAAQTVKPTCTEKGYTVYKCLTCDVSYNSDYVDEHGHSYDQEFIGETCAEGAYYLYTCSICNHQYKSEYLTEGGHKYNKTVVPANCTDRGYTIYDCSVCAYTFRDDYTAALGHNYKVTVLEPTCLEGGYSTFECKRCDDEYISDYTPPNGHSYEESVVASNCTDRGYHLHKCAACGDEYKTDETLALGHYYTERTIEVSCTQNGGVLHTCTRCGYEYETNVVPMLGHKYVTEVTMTAACEEDGNRHHICSRCGNQYDTPIPSFGHNYEITDIHTSDGETTRTYTCSICGHTYTQDLGDQYEEVSNYVEYLFRQYSPYMWWVFLAVAGVWSIAMGIAIIVAHKNEDKQKARKMLVNYVIGLVVIAVILIAAPYLVRGIAALISG